MTFAALNPLVATTRMVNAIGNITRELTPPRDAAYTALETSGTVPPAATEAEVDAALAAATFADVYTESDPTVTDAAKGVLDGIAMTLGAMQATDLALAVLSLASIYFLAAIGLAITFGVMRVINMAHGEFIMMGAYTGYVVQQFVTNYTVSILIALPLAFAVTFAAGVMMERLVIRHLYKRPLETLLATFGISIMLQQLAKNIFGTQARPLTAPGWLNGAMTFNDVVSISYIRVAIFVLALVFLGLYLCAAPAWDSRCGPCSRTRSWRPRWGFRPTGSTCWPSASGPVSRGWRVLPLACSRRSRPSLDRNTSSKAS